MKFAFYTSQVIDGSMKPLRDDKEQIQQNRHAFLRKQGIKPEATTLLNLLYGGDNYCRYLSIDESLKGDGIVRDATIDVDGLVVTRPGHAVLLPLADCIGAVLYDSVQNVLMVSHLGRHHLEQYGGAESVKYLAAHHQVTPKNLKVWLSPAAGKESYPLFAFDNRSLHDVAVEQLTSAGVANENIDVSPIDTTTDKSYFSHSQFLKGNRDTDGRFCVVALLE